MASKSTGFDPIVVAKFFATLAEFREEIKEARHELKEIREELSRFSAVFAAHGEKLSNVTTWQDEKNRECLRHQATTASVSDEIHRLREDLAQRKGTGDGLSLAWKIVAGAALLVSTVTGVLVAASKLK
jgi:chromosome segregation ATPase